ncbi:DUF2339 domain-containing protein [Rhodanobacter sp. LX-100]|nr:DUF2339 domain-containing protein [Rhodanobacter sp. LX-99]MBT2147153.1 DUF2339 domain-containing protein [Rhodanobacter sp. LX-100]
MAGLVVFMVVGTIDGSGSGSHLYGMLTGVLLGLIWARQKNLRGELDKTRALLDRALAQRVATPTPARPSEQPPAATPAATLQETRYDAAYSDAPAPAVPPPLTQPIPSATPQPRAATPAHPDNTQPDLATAAIARIKSWFTEGNVPVKIGMLVLFAGVAALLKYASDAGMLRVPIGLRLSLVALAAIIALLVGWRQRDERRVFALSLQGGAIGVLLITVFAAFRLYALLPPPAAFVLLMVLVAGVGLLAVLQEALALAVLGLLAGFLAPILTSTGHGSHVALFSYYAVLNLAILGIAWKRSWRVLNLLGFVATFGIGSAWGVLQYRPELFASTEPFLILNFLFYLAIPLLYLHRAAPDQRKLIDGCLLFGNPLISLLLQAALLQWRGQPLAFSALAAAVIYVAVAWSIRGRDHFGILRDAWAVLAIAFATLAVPLALSASLTGSVFALEGAGLIWLGLRQQRRLARWSGVALQLAAAFALVIGRSDSAPMLATAWLDRDFIGALILVAAAFASASFYARLGTDAVLQRWTAVLLYGWGLCWWLGASWNEIDRHVGTSGEAAAAMGLLALTGWAAAEAARRRPRFELGTVVAWTAPILLAAILPLVLRQLLDGQPPLWGWNLLTTLAAAALGWRTLQCLRSWPRPAMLTQLGWLWRWALVASATIKALLLQGTPGISGAWMLLLVLLPLCALAALALARPHWIAPPLVELLPKLRPPLLGSVLFVLGLYWLAGLFMAGDTAPMTYLPLLNPLELLLILIALLIARWLGDSATVAALRQGRPMVLGVLGMAVVTSATLRAVHQLGHVPWNAALFDSSLAQMSLTVVWSVFGLLAWVWGSRRGQRLLWLAGAVTMGVVLAKLLLIDRSHLGNLFGIASFIAYGLLCTVIGYLAPAPPRLPSTSTGEAADAP